MSRLKSLTTAPKSPQELTLGSIPHGIGALRTQGMFRDMKGPRTFVRPTGSFCHALMAS